LDPANRNILLQRPLDPHEWGSACLHTRHRIPDEEDILSFVETSIGISDPPTRTPSKTIATNYHQLRSTARQSFRQPHQFDIPDPVKTRHKHAIDTIQLLNRQTQLLESSSVSFDADRRLRVVATSCCLGRNGEKQRFAYRIRVEHWRDDDDDDDDETDDNDDGGGAVQLMGRKWFIREHDSTAENVNVDSPTGGAVGHLPVIKPGETFEYMSGCELSSKRGVMGGQFYMKLVNEDTEYGMVGGDLARTSKRRIQDMISNDENDDEEEKMKEEELNSFDLMVEPFPLTAHS